MSFDWKLFAGLLACLAILQSVCQLLARGLGARLERRVVALGLLLPFLFLLPWLADSSRLLAPTDILQEMIPGAPDLPAVNRHRLLNDTLLQLLPWELEIRHALRDGHLPLWSDTLEGGSSPWVNPQAGVLSPLAMLARPLPIQHFLLGMLALKILLAFEGTWLLARAVGVSRFAAGLAALSFALGGGMMTFALFPVTATLAWVPWLTLAVVRLFRRGDGLTVVTAAFLTAALLLSGHPETAAIGGLFAAVCGLSFARRRGFLRAFGGAAAAALLGFALAAPHVLPFAHRLPLTQRAQETLARSMPEHFVSPWMPITWFVPGHGEFMLSPLNPWTFGRPYLDAFQGPFHWADACAGYAGLVALAGAAVALLAGRRCRRAWPFLSLALASLLIAAQALPLARVIYAIPALRAVAYARFLLPGCLALSIAGALGIDRLLAPGRRRRLGRLLPLLALGAAAALSLAQSHAPWIAVLWALLIASSSAALFGLVRPRWAAAGLGLVVLLDLLPWARSLQPADSAALFYPPSALLEAVKRETAGGPWRSVGEEYALFPSLLPVYGIAEVRPHNPLSPVPQLRTLAAAFEFAPTTEDYFPPFHGIEHPFLDFLNVRTVIWASPNPVPSHLEPIDEGRFLPFRLYRNPRALPRWFAPSRVDVIRPADLERWIADLDDGRHVAVDPIEADRIEADPSATVRSIEAHPGRILLEVTAPRPALIATSIGWPEGWQARVDGRSLPIIVVNGAFVGFRAPAGTSGVELRFIPPGLLPGCVLAAAALLICAGLIAKRRMLVSRV